MRRRTLHVVMVCVFSLMVAACDDDNTSPPGSDGGGREGSVVDLPPAFDGQRDAPAPDGGPPGDGAVADAAGDAPVSDGPLITVDTTSFPEAGWIPTEGGIVKINDGGVLIQEDSGSVYICQVVECAGRPQACGDCIDNDGDGLVDWRDPECLGPCDNTEGPGLESGVGGTTGASCGVDCYFDYGNGDGNDKCAWNHRCDPLSPEVGCEYDADFVTKFGDTACPAEQNPTCEQVCMPYTPNGCDCFGCCTFPDLAGAGPNGADVYVWIGNMDASNNSTCTLADVTDPTKCPPCTPVGNCLNPCGRCEVCVGKPTVPEDCYRTLPPDAGVPTNEAGVPFDAGVPPDRGVIYNEAGTPVDQGVPPDSGFIGIDGGVIVNPWQCDPGIQPCGLPGQLPCATGYTCITGCCKRIIL